MALFQKSVLNQYIRTLDKSKVADAYAKFKAHFHNATIQQQIRESKEEQYQEGFFRDLFVDVLGYTLNPQPNFNLTTELKNESDSKKADGAILITSEHAHLNDIVVAVIELKGTNTTDLNKVTQQAFSYKNNQKQCKYVIISNFEKLRFYIDNAIDFEEFNLFTLSESEFTLLYVCLHKDYLLNDIPLQLKQTSTVKEENITKQLYKDYSDFKRKLFENIVHLNPQYEKLILFKKSQKLLDRILFILFAEDRNLIPANTIHTILNEWQQLQKLNVKVPLYDRFKNHFNYLNDGFKNDQYEVFGYNGGLFAKDDILDAILIDDNLLQNYTPTLSKYDYETEVDVNILGHIFEHSLNDIDEIQAELLQTSEHKTSEHKTSEHAHLSKKISKRKKDGVFYTPKYITKYIVENTVGALCAEKRNEFEIIADNYTPDKRKAQKKELLQKLDAYQSWLLQITIVDPACGSGAFLNQALDFLIQEHRNIDELKAQLLGESIVLPDHEVAILENNIFGVDLNEESVEIARLSLWLRTARKGRKLNSLNNNIKCGNSLIDDVTIAGDKAFI
jgi:type I restriction-modification system DNA methylase subunit